MRHTQLDLFAGSQELCQLRSENAYLKERLETAKGAYRTLRDELQAVRAQVRQQQMLEHELHRARQEVELWRTRASMWRTQAEVTFWTKVVQERRRGMSTWADVAHKWGATLREGRGMA